MIQPLHRWAAAAAASLTFATAVAAVQAHGVSVRSGGADVEEFTEMNRQAQDYQLKLILAAKHSGAYLADVDVVVRALPSREIVLEHRSEGPLVLAQLPPGRYEVAATYGQVVAGAPSRLTRTVTVPPSGNLAQMVMYFDTGDDLSPRSPPEYSTR